MKDCTNFKHSRWNLTSTGKLHPSGSGTCIYTWKMPALPGSMYWLHDMTPKPYGGLISRKEELTDHCVYFARKEAP